jgi:hypothetical protein
MHGKSPAPGLLSYTTSLVHIQLHIVHLEIIECTWDLAAADEHGAHRVDVANQRRGMDALPIREG